MKLTRLINTVKLEILSNKKCITILKPTKEIEKIISCLIKNNIIIQKVVNGRFITLYLNIANKIYIKNIYKNSHRRTITLNMLKKKYWLKTKNIYILSTSIGILSHQDAIKYGVGGVILFKIFN